jgi:ferredoxin
VDRAAKTWTLDEDACVGCGTCAEACPKDAIIL